MYIGGQTSDPMHFSHHRYIFADDIHCVDVIYQLLLIFLLKEGSDTQELAATVLALTKLSCGLYLFVRYSTYSIF
jgi:hypothetical protein